MAKNKTELYIGVILFVVILISMTNVFGSIVNTQYVVNIVVIVAAIYLIIKGMGKV